MNLKNITSRQKNGTKALVRRISNLASNMPSQSHSSNRSEGSSGSRTSKQTRKSRRDICRLWGYVLQLQVFVSFFYSYLFSVKPILNSASSEVDQLRTETQTTQSESAFVACRTANVMTFNFQLQTSVQKNQAQTIDLEFKEYRSEGMQRAFKHRPSMSFCSLVIASLWLTPHY